MAEEIKTGAFGIEQLEDVQDVIIEGIRTGKIVTEDKKFNLMDVPAILPMTKPLQEAIDGGADTDDEFLDLYDDEIDQLVERYDTKVIGILNEQQSKVGRRILKIAYNAGALVREVRA